MKALLSSLVLFLALSRATLAQTPANEATVRTSVANFEKAFNAHEAKAFAATFAQDADFTNWLGMSAHARTNIEEFYVPVLTVTSRNGTMKAASSTIRFIQSNVAAVGVRSEVTGGLTPDG